MPIIKIADLKPNASELKTLSERETMAIAGSDDTANKIDFDVNVDVDVDVRINIQINNNLNFQIAINGNNFNLAELSNIIESSYS